MHTQYRFSLLQILILTVIGFSLSACQQLAPQKTAKSYVLKSSDATETIQKNEKCVDFLALVDTKPLELEFVGCNASFYNNSHSFIANYKVKGKDVLTVQEQLHNISGMPRLVKDCCHWRTLNVATGQKNGMIDIKGKRYYINMQSTELRLGWNIAADIEHIPYFHVQVMHPLDK